MSVSYSVDVGVAEWCYLRTFDKLLLDEFFARSKWLVLFSTNDRTDDQLELVD